MVALPHIAKRGSVLGSPNTSSVACYQRLLQNNGSIRPDQIAMLVPTHQSNGVRDRREPQCPALNSEGIASSDFWGSSTLQSYQACTRQVLQSQNRHFSENDSATYQADCAQSLGPLTNSGQEVEVSTRQNIRLFRSRLSYICNQRA